MERKLSGNLVVVPGFIERPSLIESLKELGKAKLCEQNDKQNTDDREHHWVYVEAPLDLVHSLTKVAATCCCCCSRRARPHGCAWGGRAAKFAARELRLIDDSDGAPEGQCLSKGVYLPIGTSARDVAPHKDSRVLIPSKEEVRVHHRSHSDADARCLQVSGWVAVVYLTDGGELHIEHEATRAREAIDVKPGMLVAWRNEHVIHEFRARGDGAQRSCGRLRPMDDPLPHAHAQVADWPGRSAHESIAIRESWALWSDWRPSR
jgi:hypothetical protein